MKSYRQRRVREAGGGIETLLVSYQKKEASSRIASCYKQVSRVQVLPPREHLEFISVERAEIYRCRTPEGICVPILVTPSEVENGVPKEAEVAQLVWKFKGGRAGRLLDMWAEDLKGWLREASRDKNQMKSRWRLLVSLI